MIRVAGLLGTGALLLLVVGANPPSADETAAEAMVGTDGTIMMTERDYRRDWTALGAWAHPGSDGVARFNVVYTQPGTVTAYRRTGAFPEGTVLIKELREAVTTGDGSDRVSSFGALTGWFVMIKPPKTGGPTGPLWGEGWGWAKFDVDAPTATVTTNFRSDCLQCHQPVRSTDWVHISGYPLLRE